jgi:phosphatidate cytidylyltransferase
LFLQNLFSDKARVTTGIALIAAVVLLGLIDNFFLTWLTLGGLFIIAFYESMKLFSLENNSIYLYALLLWIVAAYYPNPDDLVFVVIVIFASSLAYNPEFDKKLFLPFLYPAAPFLFLMALYNDFGVSALAWLLVVVAGVDIGAYTVGKSIGKTPFSVTSPNKTMEGVIGGIVIGGFLGAFIGLTYLPFFTALIISILVAIASVFGDLFESYLKRAADVKDSGDILPGHGGILDRLDGYLFGGIIMIILLRGLV